MISPRRKCRSGGCPKEMKRQASPEIVVKSYDEIKNEDSYESSLVSSSSSVSILMDEGGNNNACICFEAVVAGAEGTVLNCTAAEGAVFDCAEASPPRSSWVERRRRREEEEEEEGRNNKRDNDKHGGSGCAGDAAENRRMSNNNNNNKNNHRTKGGRRRTATTGAGSSSPRPGNACLGFSEMIDNGLTKLADVLFESMNCSVTEDTCNAWKTVPGVDCG